MKKILLIIGFCFVYFPFNYAQMSAGITLGCINYQGDLVKGYVDLKEINIGYGLLMAKQFDNPKFSLKGQLQLGEISGNDANYPDRQNRGAKFTSPITFIGSAIEYAPFARNAFNSDGDFIPQTNVFVSGGFGVTFCNPKVEGLAANAPDRNADIPKTLLTIPLGIGLRFDMTEEWALSFQGSFFITSTDYLDGISIAGTPGNNDYFFFYGLSLAKKWGMKKK
jgi:OmpA-OmpF porin, OOP family